MRIKAFAKTDIEKMFEEHTDVGNLKFLELGDWDEDGEYAYADLIFKDVDGTCYMYTVTRVGYECASQSLCFDDIADDEMIECMEVKPKVVPVTIWEKQ